MYAHILHFYSDADKPNHILELSGFFLHRIITNLNTIIAFQACIHFVPHAGVPLVGLVGETCSGLSSGIK